MLSCEFEGCDRKATPRSGLCTAHSRQKRMGEEVRVLRKIRKPRANLSGLSTEEAQYHHAQTNRRNKLRVVGWTPEMVDITINLQGGTCANTSCDNEVMSQGKGKQHVDHDHETMEPRGVMCQGCNIALGQLREDPERIRGLAEYAEQCINARMWVT